MKQELEHLLKIASNAFEVENFDVALKNYQIASEKGSFYADISIALMHSLGLGLPADAKVSEAILLGVIDSKNCEIKVKALAAHNLGTLYLTGGENLPSNAIKGFKYQRLAEELGFPI